MSQGRMIGVYQPRTRRARVADRVEDVRRRLNKALNALALRGAGARLLVGSLAGFVARLSYSADDPSLDNATSAAASNWLGGFGSTAADLLLEAFGLAAIAALLPPCVWGARALFGRHVSPAQWRAFAWPAGAVLLAAGLGLLPAPFTLPARTGGLIGSALGGLLVHVPAQMSWLATAIPLVFLLAGLPLAFFATGLSFWTVIDAAMATPAAVRRVGSMIHMPEFLTRRSAKHAVEETEYEDEEEDYEEGDEE